MQQAIALQQGLIAANDRLRKVSDDAVKAQTEVIDRQADLIKFYEDGEKRKAPACQDCEKWDDCVPFSDAETAFYWNQQQAIENGYRLTNTDASILRDFLGGFLIKVCGKFDKKEDKDVL